MPSILTKALTLAVVTSALALSGCSTLLPREYKDYNGSDAASLVVQQQDKTAGLLYLDYYEKKGDCFEKTEAYKVNPNVLNTGDRVFIFRIPPGKFFAIEESYKVRKQPFPLAPYGNVLVIKRFPFVSQSGKRYYFVVDHPVREIPNDYPVTSNTRPDKVISEFPQMPQLNWDVTKRCQHIFGNE